MKQYSVETYKKVLSMTEYIRHKRETSYWDMVVARTKLMDVGSTWIVQIGKGSQSRKSTLEKYDRNDKAKTRNSAYSKIEKLIIESFYCIDPEYRVYVYDLYLRPDRRRLRNSSAAEADRYGYDRRKFVPQLNSAIERAAKTRKVSGMLEEIENIALENEIDELISIFMEDHNNEKKPKNR